VTALITVFSTSAFAASDYGVQITNELHLGGVGVPQDCYEDGTDMTTQWSQIMQDNTGPTTPYSYQNTWNWGSDYDNAQYKLTNFVTRFRNSLNSESGKGWAVSQVSEFEFYSTSDPNFDTFHKMIRIWAFDPDTTFTLEQGQLLASKKIYYTDYLLNPNCGCRWQAWNYQEVEATSMIFSHNKFLFVNAQTINYPQDYAGPTIGSGHTPPTPTYVAMGDSFSSGEGNPSFEHGTDEDGVNTCHRSPQAYPRLLQDDPDLHLGPATFVACSGATTWNILNGQENEPAQVKALSTNTKVVTITIGGNDVGFKDFATACTVDICNFSTTAYSTIVGKINYELPASLKNVLDTIATKVSSTTKVYVVGYPHVAPPKMPTGANSACWPLNGQLDNPNPKKNDGAAVRDVVTKLNTTIFNTVKGTNDGRFTYVDPNETGSPFIGHDWCKGDERYFTIIDLPNPITGGAKYAFHPTSKGHAAYKEVIKSKM
jgi:hypothetical protein